ncbi:MAG: polymerase most-like protein containing domain hydrolase domain and Zn-ribbon domain [Proteobacteria bacterium]|nr:polymerase most-like protein containing domain hydrolase domain and Zn-ribbon domain [Pseudomonadota bacterium]
MSEFFSGLKLPYHRRRAIRSRLVPISNPDSSAQTPAAGASELILPGYIRQEMGGVYVDLTQLPSGQEFERIIERIFTAGYYLPGLDYASFQSLLYGSGDFGGLIAVRLAQEIAIFPPERQSLYRAPNIGDDSAEYMFEPAFLEKTVEVPLYDTGEDGQEVQVGVERRTERVPTELDFDEFIANAWISGLRFGIDAKRVRELLLAKQPERVDIAHSLPPTEGSDAGVEEQTKALHRSNSPRLLPDGRVDLSQYANRFPQIQKGTLLLLKKPRQLGEAGRKLDGAALEPRLPDDFEFSKLAGENTHVERYNDREYLVASISGFLNIDTNTNQISITEKIINRDGVSSRTTGNLVLQGDQYEEYGEVQEGSAVEGKDLIFHADVFGRVASVGGKIVLESNLAGGMALNRDGDIEVQGMASSAVVRTARGAIRVKRAENTLLVADRIEIESAYQCTILAEEVEIGMAAGCTVAGKRVHIGELRDHGSEETLISMLMPDLSGFELLLADERKYIAECEKMLADLRHALSTMTSQPELQHYLVVAGKLHRKEIKLAPQQQGDWQQLGARMAPTLKRIKQARDDVSALETEIEGIRERIAKIEADKKAAGDGIACHLDNVQGEVRVRQMVILLDAPPLTRMSPRDLRTHLRQPVAADKTLFGSSSGEFSWQHQAAAEGAEKV